MIKYLTISLLCISLISCAYMGQRIRGNGQITTEERQLSDFKGVSVAGSYNVHVTTGENYQVKIEADENLLPYIETRIEGGVLKVETADNYNLKSKKGITVFVTAPVYNKFSIAGSGNINGENEIIADDKMNISVAGSGNINLLLKAPVVNTSISGSGDISLEGDADEITGSISGSGNLRAIKLKARDVRVKIAGSGNAEVSAEEKLEANIAGSGDVLYAGNPQTDSKIAGSGSIRRID